MATPYDRLRSAFLDELQFAPQREFEKLLAKASLHVSQKVRLTNAEKEELFQVYLKAHHDDQYRSPKKEPIQPPETTRGK